MASTASPSIMDQINALEPAVLRIFRDAEEDIGYREALIYIDGELAAELEYRQFVELHLTPGVHTIRAYNRVFKSKRITLDLQPGERVTMQTGNVGGGCFLLSMILTMGVPSIFLKVDRPEDLQTDRIDRARRASR